MNVYFNEYNVRMGQMSYLPLVSGLLRAAAETSATVRWNYQFKPFIYAVDPAQKILANYDEPPAVAAFSVSMWNEQLSLTIAREIKRKWPDCLIVFGGAQVPHHASLYMAKHPFIDACVRGEGEDPFTEILERFVSTRDFSGIAGVTWAGGENEDERKFERDLDRHPSPYLEGLFDDIVDGELFQAIVETNRGCPFKCTFCYWGHGGLTRKYKYFGIDRVKAELDWCAAHGIKYVFNADSNFGMHKRDKEIADYLVDLKRRTGYPEKFRTCFGKNTDDKIFEIGALLHANDLEKGITLARQSNDPTVLENIKRSNISMDTYRNLQTQFNALNIPIYSELIIGLPGETKETWTRGIDELLRAGLKNQLFAYFAQILPNTDMADPAYRERFGIESRFIELNEIHGSIRDTGLVTEYEEIVIATDSMSTGDWRDIAVFSWMTMLMHSLKLGFFVMDWLFDERGVPHIDFIAHMAAASGAGPIAELVFWFHDKLDDMLAGQGRGCIAAGDIYWDVEEAAFIRAMLEPDAFYDDMARLVDVPDAVIRYQQSRIPTVEMYGGDVQEWARKTILWGRKSGTMLVPERQAA